MICSICGEKNAGIEIPSANYDERFHCCKCGTLFVDEYYKLFIQEARSSNISPLKELLRLFKFLFKNRKIIFLIYDWARSQDKFTVTGISLKVNSREISQIGTLYEIKCTALDKSLEECDSISLPILNWNDKDYDYFIEYFDFIERIIINLNRKYKHVLLEKINIKDIEE